MKIKRFFAVDARQAMKMVKGELGEDAVILSNKRVSGGVELVAAIDYEEEAFVTVAAPPSDNGSAEAAPVSQPQPSHQQSAPRGAPSASPRSGSSRAAAQSPSQSATFADGHAAGRAPGTPRQASDASFEGGHRRSQFSESISEPVSEPAQPSVASHPAPEIEAAARPSSKPSIVWSQEPTLVEMRSEIKNMRGLLENQLRNLTSQDFRASHPCQYELKNRLSQLGISHGLAKDFIEHLPPQEDVEALWRRLLAKLAISVPVTEDDILVNGGVVALVGPTGVGKTTSVAKLAARYALRHGSRDVALITTDNYRIGAHEQIKAYARILGVPYRFANSAESLQNALDHFCDRRLVLIDTAGMSQKDLRLTAQLAVLNDSVSQVQPYLVMSATSSLTGLDEVVRAFSNIDLKGVILTKIDESTSLGHALDVVIRHRLPLAYLSDGQRVPEDLQPARGHELVNQAIVMMQENADLLDSDLSNQSTGEVYS